MADIPRIEGYHDLVRVARGGFAVVYRARQERFDRVVALKVLSIDEIDERAQRRFERECRVMGSLSWHPNVVAVLDSGVADGHPWMAMEFLDAGALSDRLERDGPVPWAEVVDIGVQVAGALGAAHASGVLHRDLKPENLLVGPFGEAKLADFGIAAVEGGTRTTTGSASFTVAHVAPEILEGKPPDERSDLYGLASTLHTLVTGSPPMVSASEESIATLITRILQTPAPRLTEVPGDLADVIEAGLAKDPDDRPQSAQAFGERLQAVQAGHGLAPTALRLAPTSTATSAAVAASTADPPASTTAPDAEPVRTDPDRDTRAGLRGETVARSSGADGAAPAAAVPGGSQNQAPPAAGRRIGRWVALAGGLVIVTAGIALLASRSGTSEDPVPPSVEATIDVGRDPRDLVATDDAVWVTTYADNRVDRIDPTTDEAAGTDSQDNGPQGITSNDDGVWVGNYSDGTLTRIDPDSGETTDTVELGDSVQDVAAADGAVWAALLDDEVVRYDIETGELGAPIAVGAGPQGIAVDGDGVWVTSIVDDMLTRIDPETGTVDTTIQLDGGPFGVAIGLDAVWVVTGEGTVHRVDPATDELTDTIDVGGSLWGVVVADGAVWATDNAANSVIRIDPDTVEVTDTLPVGGSPLGITAGADALWVANADDDTVTRIDPGDA